MIYNTIAIDDEIASLNRFSRLIKAESRINLLEVFSRADDALEFIANTHVDLVFLDIEMPEMNGLELANRILSTNSEIDIIFITAHQSFAFQAFNVYATGYLLKPITSDEILKLMSVIEKRKIKNQENETELKLYVNSFGNVSCSPRNEQGERIRWRTSKCEELILYLVHQKTAVSRDKVIDELWPDMSYEKAIKNLHVTCYNIRCGLKKVNLKDVIIKNHGNYVIDKNRVISDYWEFIAMLNDMKVKKIDFDYIDILVKKYKEGYLNNKYYEWSEYARDWMAIELEKMLFTILESYNNETDFEKEIDILLKIVSINDCNEKAYEQLIKMSMVSGNKSLATKLFQKYKKMLNQEFGIEVPKWIVELF